MNVKQTNNDTKCIAEWLWKFRSCRSTKNATNELLKVDLIRNSISKQTIYYYLTMTKRFYKEGVAGKLPIAFVEEFKKFIEKEKPIIPKVQTFEEKLSELKAKKDKIHENFNIASNKIREKIVELEKQLDFLINACDIAEESIDADIDEIYIEMSTEKLYKGV